MKIPTIKQLALAGAALSGISALLIAEETKPKAEAAVKADVAGFESKITRDTSEVRGPSQPSAGYADVVQRILPSVVSIGTYSKKPQRRGGFGDEELNQLPPGMREFFEQWMERQGQAPGQAPQGKRRQTPQSRKPVQTGLGSGVILTDNGYILTNNHVVEGADELKVSVPGKTKEFDAKVIGTDPSSDIALIKIEGAGLAHATIGDSAKMRVGDVVLAAGSPMGLDQSVTHGIVSALGRRDMGIIENKGKGGYENFIQTDAAINPGNSGGPLLDSQGRVIGINSAIETKSGMFSGVGFAIPINMALVVAHDLLDTGKVARGFLGIQMDAVDPSMADFLGLKDERGVTVSRIVPDSPAAKAGFEEGDVVVSADGQKVDDIYSLRLAVSSHRPGSQMKMGIVRFNDQTRKPERKELIAKLEALPEKMNEAFNRTQDDGAEKKVKPAGFLTGVRVENITDELREHWKIEPDVKGVVVTSVEDSSPASKVGLQEGDVITQVNGKSVTSAAEAKAGKGEGEGMVRLRIVRNGQTKFLVVKS